MKLSILCQSPIVVGRTAAEAIHDTVRLARLADDAGYHRFWVSEHHSDRALAGSSPEILVSHLASITRRIRVGTGGVLLPYQAPYKVAEQFNMLEALFPGRIDLGVGRAGGSEGRAPQALGRRVGPAFADVDELLSWLGPGTPKRPFAEVFASPPVPRPPPVWMLGSSPASAKYAGERGLPYAFAGFLDPREMMTSIATYHQHFQPSGRAATPQVILGWFAIIGETEQHARRLAASSESWFLDSFVRGGNKPFPTADVALAERRGPQEELILAMKRQACAMGTAQQVFDQLEALGRQLRLDEVMVVSITDDAQARFDGYARLAEVAGLSVA
jgi:luciferase family oxidoreductase group 1